MEPESFIEYFFEEYTVLSLTIIAVLAIIVIRRLFFPTPAVSELAQRPHPSKEDLVAEADFHFAYGLYDKAGESVRKALLADPSSPDLVLKLLEVHFASGDDAAFLELANSYKDQFGRSVHWEPIREMGQKMLPDERLFR